MTAFIAEFGGCSYGDATMGTCEFKLVPTLTTEFGPLTIVKLALGAFHFFNLSSTDSFAQAVTETA